MARVITLEVRSIGRNADEDDSKNDGDDYITEEGLYASSNIEKEKE